jgi:hypothetical protein
MNVIELNKAQQQEILEVVNFTCTSDPAIAQEQERRTTMLMDALITRGVIREPKDPDCDADDRYVSLMMQMQDIARAL